MKNDESKTLEQKTWRSAQQKVKAEWQEAWNFDRRGIWLSVLLLLACACVMTTILGQKQKWSTWQEVLLAASFLGSFLINFFLAQILKHRYSKGVAVAGAFVIAVIVVVVVAVIVVVVVAVIPAVVGAVAGFGAFAFAVAVAFIIIIVAVVYNVAVVFILAVVSAVFIAFAFVGFFAFLGIYAVVGGVAFAVAFAFAYPGLIVILRFHLRAFRLFQRSREFEVQGPESWSDYRETTPKRCDCRATLANLQHQKRSLTLGLAGRRGLGKTALLRYVLQENAFALPTSIQSDRDLKDRDKVKTERLRLLRLFVATPTEFAEQVFLMALLERVAQAFNQVLIRLLPSVQSFKVEQELREKRRLLRISHLVIIGLIVLNVGLSFYYLNTTSHAPVLGQFFFKSDSTVTNAFFPPKIYKEMRDSLLAELRVQAAPLQDSLAQVDVLLNPKVTMDSWNLKGIYGAFKNEFLIQTTWDSLKNLKSWPKLDSLRQTSRLYQAILDSIKVVSMRYQAISDSATLLSEGPFAKENSLWQSSGWFWFNCFLLLMLPFVYWRTREGESRFSKSAYSVVRNEVALYERTNALLERLHFQMSFGENRETGLGFSRSGLQLTRRISRQVQRQARPYTTMSLIDEYREYITDAKMYLNHALKMSDPETQEHFQIIIAIDELDKILNTEKLHNMLKSMKAIFEIEDVYYILSISEDALETYRLRHVDTKNEIDSAFTHIIPVPPMNARGSLAFYVEHHTDWKPHLLPAAIVFGGGVPRDMHRLSQLFGTYPAEFSLEDCLQKLVDEDIVACTDMVLLNAHLSDEGKQVWLKILGQTGFTSAAKTKKLLGEIEAYTLDEFVEINPVSGETAKEQFHRLRSLIRGVVVKGFIYHAVQNHPTPEKLASWPRKSKLKSFIKRLPEETSLEDWLAQLEPLRDAIFELSRNPLRVWENLPKA